MIQEKNTVIYARYSSAKQHEQSIEGQLRICREFAKKRGFKVLYEYIDRAASGTNDNRSEFKKMLADSYNQSFQYVIVYQYDRFARNRRDSLNNKFILNKNGVKLLSATEPEITDDPTDIFIEGILETVAEYYSKDLAKKTKRGMSESINKRQSIGGKPLLGYKVDKNKKIIIDLEAAELVKRIFKLYNMEYSLRDIADEALLFGYKISLSSITRIVTSRNYIGEYINPFNPEEIIYDMYPAIIDTKTFKRAQEIANNKKHKKSGKKTKDNDDYILSGKIFCGYCGRRLVGVCGYSKSGKVYKYYVCQNKECNKKSEKKFFIENYVGNQVYEYLTNDKRLDHIVESILKGLKSKRNATRLSELQLQQSSVEKEIDKIALSFLDAGPVIKERLEIRSKELKSKLDQIDAEIRKEMLLNNEKVVSKDFIRKYIKMFLKSCDNSKNYISKLFHQFLNSVYLFDDKVVTYLNFAENAKIIAHIEMLNDLEVIDKEKSDHNMCSDEDSDGDPYGIRTHECMRERHMS